MEAIGGGAVVVGGGCRWLVEARIPQYPPNQNPNKRAKAHWDSADEECCQLSVLEAKDGASGSLLLLLRPVGSSLLLFAFA